MWRRFWFRSRVSGGEYTPEVLHAGWVPLSTEQPTLFKPAHSLQFMAPASRTAKASSEAAEAAGAGGEEADAAQWLMRFYANQGC